MTLVKIHSCVLLLLLSLSVIAQNDPSKPTYAKSQKTEIINGKKYYIHTIAPKQTLFSIAKMYGVTIEDIIKENPIAAKGVTINQQLNIPFINTPEKATIDPSNEDNPNDTTTTETAGNAQYNRSSTIKTINDVLYYIHTIQPKQTLYATANLYVVDVNEIITLNPDVAKSYKIGEELIIPVIGFNSKHKSKKNNKKNEVSIKADNHTALIKINQPARENNNNQVSQAFYKHTIQPKQTLYSIAKYYSVTVEELKKINLLTGVDIEIGDTLLIPINKDNERISTTKTIKQTSLKSINSNPIEKNTSLKYLNEPSNTESEIFESETYTKGILKNIFFRLDTHTLLPESIPELNRLLNFLNNHQQIRIEISVHTDNEKSRRFNKKLSENRAHEVVEFLINNGIDTTRLEFKGYAFDSPITSNDTEEGKQLNRRTEFKILK